MEGVECGLCLVAGGHGGLDPLGNAVELLVDGFLPLFGNLVELGEVVVAETGACLGDFDFAVDQRQIRGGGGNAVLEAVANALHQASAGDDQAGLAAGGFHPPFGGVAGGIVRILECEELFADRLFGGFGFTSEAGKQALIVGEGGLGGC